MNAASLMTDLHQLGIRLETNGDRLRYFPRSSVTPALLARMCKHKAELLTMLRPAPCAKGTVGWAEVVDAEGHLAYVRADVTDEVFVDPPDPCETCGAVERWQDGKGAWRCPTCNPHAGHGARLRALAELLRKPSGRPAIRSNKSSEIDG